MILYGIDNIRDLFGPKVLWYTVIQNLVPGAFYSYSDFSGWFQSHQEQPTMPVGTASEEVRGGQLDEDTLIVSPWIVVTDTHPLNRGKCKMTHTFLWNCSENEMCESYYNFLAGTCGSLFYSIVC
jgi:hypothetical protein